MAFDVVSTVLATDVATNGTFTTGYPNKETGGSYTGGYLHRMIVPGGRVLLSPADFTVSFGTTTATITWKGTTTLPAGTTVRVQYDKVGKYPWTKPELLNTSVKTYAVDLAILNLGSPVANSSTAITTSQALLAATLTGAALSGTTAGVLDVARNVVAAWTGTSVITVKGTDVYGNAMTESSASGTSFTGKKAFKTVTLITVSADVTGLTVGTGNVLGLPVFLPGTGYVLRELQDGSAPTAGTIVKADTAVATATTGDVRGTYTPNATPDGTKDFALICSLESLARFGVTQF